MKKIGIFGGAFNPPHEGHTELAINTKQVLRLDTMLIMPTNISPHKKKAAVSFEDRLEMCRLAFGGIDGFEINDIEGRLPSPNHTVNTVNLIKKKYPKNTAFYLIIGSDMLFCFDQWYKYEIILKACTVVSAAREISEYSDMLECAAELGGGVKILNFPVKSVSSSTVRKRLMNREDIGDLVSEKVKNYIKEKGLYL